MIWVMTLSCFVLSASVLFVNGSVRSDDGMAAWGWSMLLHGLSYPAFALRLHGWLIGSILLANLFISATMALQLLAIWQFRRAHVPALRRWLLWLPVVATVAVGGALVENHPLRQTLLSACGMLQAGLLAWQAGWPGLGQPHEKGRQLLWLGSSGLMAVFLTRGLLVLPGGDWQRQVSIPYGVQSFTYLGALLVMLLNNVGFVLMYKERAAAQQRELAARDPLTGIANRRALMEALRHHVALAARRQAPLSVLMIDIDFFKQVNDRHGHMAGDAVLCAVAERIGQRLRAQDVLGRYGGEEFMILLPHTDADGAVRLAEDVRWHIEQTPIAFAGAEISITLSIGVHSRVPPEGHDAGDAMLAAADRALYAAKASGRNRGEFAGA
ncbi:MAG: GGDEF domain-containing protein [Arenimonas sp.]